MDNRYPPKNPRDPREFAFVLRYRQESSEYKEADRVIVSLNYANGRSDWRFTELEDAFEKIRTTITTSISTPLSQVRKH